MSNFSRQTLVQLGRLLEEGDTAGAKPADHLAKLAEWSGIGRKALYNWCLPEGHAQHRAMPESTKRQLAIIAYFAMTGQLNDQRLKDIEALEAAMSDQAQFNRVARRVSMVLRSMAPEAEKSAEDATAEIGQEAA